MGTDERSSDHNVNHCLSSFKGQLHPDFIIEQICSILLKTSFLGIQLQKNRVLIDVRNLIFVSL